MKKKLALITLFTVYQIFIPFVTSYFSKGYARHYVAEAKQPEPLTLHKNTSDLDMCLFK